MEGRHFSSLYPANARAHEISQAISYVLAGNASQVIGVPGVGRSVFLGLLAHNSGVRKKHLGEKAAVYHFILVDFTNLKGENLPSVVKRMLFSMAESLEDRSMTDEALFVRNILQEHVTSEDSELLFQSLHRAIDYLAHEKDRSVVFLLDAVEVYAPYLDPKFFTHITALRDHMRYKLSFIFSSNRPLETIVDKELSTEVEKLISGHTIWLSLADPVSNDFVRGFLEKQFRKTLKEKSYDALLRETGGHAKLMKVSIEEILQQSVATDQIADFLRENKAVKSVCEEIWDSLQAHEQEVLRKILQGITGEDAEGLQYLIQAQLLTQEKQFTIPLLASFVQHVQHEARERFSYRPETNDLLKGPSVISENFTPTEFRLLTYLLSRPEEVIDRDTLIANAWQGIHSTAGVTEQALDQLLYRLRRKIEEDPNNPHHLHTIKGRGVKFLP